MRFASTSASASGSTSTPLPFPAHRNPTPYQIFHLPLGASQAEIKARYYELARLYHPDSPAAHGVPPNLRHARFHAITKAYDVLRGKSYTPLGTGSSYSHGVDYAAELERRKRQFAQRRAHRPAPDVAAGVGGDDAWKDQLLIFVGVTSLVIGFAPALMSLYTIPDRRHRTASANLAQARADARAYGHERREAIHAHVAEYERQKAAEGDPPQAPTTVHITQEP
ncbi:hypothetical protein BC834DRAFT_972133 [Gloeopeniophorella convolvens]|nr:hypothetical protein BC834DRAFT_972133 [Gloeopeniophorella convolvens]